MQGDAEVRIGVLIHPQRLAHTDFDAQFFPDFPPQAGGQVGVGIFQLPTGEFPQAPQHTALRALGNQDEPVFSDDRRGDRVVRDGGFGFAYGQLRLAAARVRQAFPPQRAAGAVRRFGFADQRAEFHQRLVVVARAFAREGVFGGFPQLFFDSHGAERFAQIHQARKHPADVRVQGWGGKVEGNGSNRAGGVAPDAWQRAQGVQVRGQLAAVLLAEQPGALVQVARAAVIAQPFPGLQHVLLRSRRQAFQVRKSAHKAFKVWNDGFDLGLLEHNFGNPDAVGRDIRTPGQMPGVLVVPREQRRR